MHSLKPSGDNIAQEFLRLVGQQSLVKSASADEKKLDSVHAELTEKFDSAEDHAEFDEGLNMTMTSEAEDAAEDAAEAFNADSFAHDDLEDMLTEESDDSLLSAAEDIDQALDSFSATASEKKVLAGLSKIAGSLRTKGEAFAADVVEATALSIKGDLQKEAGRRSHVVSELKKLASEFYKGNDPLAGDMVQVTINKLEG